MKKSFLLVIIFLITIFIEIYSQNQTVGKVVQNYPETKYTVSKITKKTYYYYSATQRELILRIQAREGKRVINFIKKDNAYLEYSEEKSVKEKTFADSYLVAVAVKGDVVIIKREITKL